MTEPHISRIAIATAPQSMQDSPASCVFRDSFWGHCTRITTAQRVARDNSQDQDLRDAASGQLVHYRRTLPVIGPGGRSDVPVEQRVICGDPSGVKCPGFLPFPTGKK